MPMRKIKTVNHSTDTLFVLALFCIFAASVLSVLLAGASAYQDIADRMESQYAERTCLSYLDAKIRHYDEIGMVSVESFGGQSALALYEDYDNVRYKTLIYYANGYVRELFFEEGLEFQPENGQIVIPAKGLQVTYKADNLLQLECIGQDDRQETLLIYLHSGKGAEQHA